VAFAPIVRRWQKRHEGCDSTGLSNMDALKGRVVEVIEAIPEHGTGRVRVDGDRWQARCVDDSEVAVGTRVRIVGYDSIILEVEKL
jgi:membrane protein implicated in regulation of membrane protease activity